MKRFYCDVFMLGQPLIVFFCFGRYFNYVVISLAPLLLYVSIYSKCLSTTTRIGALITTILKLWFLSLIYCTWMISAIWQFTTDEFWFAFLTIKIHQSGPNLPVYVLPLNLLLIIHTLYKTIEVKEPVCHMLSNYMSMKINKYFGIRTHHPLILIICK